MISANEARERFRNISRWVENGCGNHGCEFARKPKKIGTNSICQCRRRIARDMRELAFAMEKRGEP